MITRYQKRISGPMLDRNRHSCEKFSEDRFGEPSATIRERVEAARKRQRRRITCNADRRPARIRQSDQLDETRYSIAALSAHAHHRVFQLARSLTDLAGEEKIAPTHLVEALQYRPKLGIMEPTR